MTEIQTLNWIKENLSTYIKAAIIDSIYPESLIAGLTCRESGGIISKWAAGTKDLSSMLSIMRGDFDLREGETIRKAHGFGPTQIDIDSYRKFVVSGDWKDPTKVYALTISILNGKRNYILAKTPDSLIKSVQENLLHYVVASYNNGQGNEMKVINRHLDPDTYTTGHNYSKDVFRLAEIYKNIMQQQ